MESSMSKAGTDPLMNLVIQATHIVLLLQNNLRTCDGIQVYHF